MAAVRLRRLAVERLDGNVRYVVTRSRVECPLCSSRWTAKAAPQRPHRRAQPRTLPPHPGADRPSCAALLRSAARGSPMRLNSSALLMLLLAASSCERQDTPIRYEAVTIDKVGER